MLVGWQEGSEGSLNCVWIAANRMTRVAVVRTFAMEADVVRRRNEKCLQQVIVGQLIDFCRDVENAPGNWHRTTEAEQSDG